MAIINTDSIGIIDQRILSNTSAVTVSTVPAGKYHNKPYITIFNTDGTTTATVYVYLVPNGQTAISTYQPVPAITVDPNTSYDLPISHDLPPGHSVQVKSSVANIIAVTYSARVLS